MTAGQETEWGKPVNDSPFIKINEENTEVIGLLKDITPDEKYSKPDQPKRLYHLELPGGKDGILSDNAQLKAITEDMIGKLIRIVYTGTKGTKSGGTVKLLDIFVKDPDEAPLDLRSQFPSLG